MNGGEAPPSVKTETGGAAAKAVSPQEEGRQMAEPSAQAGAVASGLSQMGSGDRVLAERIDFYREKKLEWDETAGRAAGAKPGAALPETWIECAQAVESALSGYQQLQAGQEGMNPWEVVRLDLNYFNKGCDQVFASVQSPTLGPQGTTAALAPDRADEQLRQFFEAGQYQEAVTAYEAMNKAAQERDGSIPSGGQEAQPSREAKTYYGRALVKLGRLHEAAKVLTELLQGTDQGADVATFEVRVLTGDVLLADGQVDAARQVYEGVAKALRPVVDQQAWAAAHAQAFSEQVNDEDLGLYRELIQAYLGFDGRRVPQVLVDGVSKLKTGPLVDLARLVQTKALAQSQAWARAQLAEARALLEAHDLIGARELSEELAAAAPEEMKSSIAQLQSEIIQAEVTAQEGPPPAEGQQTASPWEAALHLFEQQKYDEAIAGFQKLLTGEHGAEAQAKMAEATELAAAAMRRQAAALYAKARKTFDPAAKRQTLLSSRALLLELIEKYPQSSVVDKARQNLKVLDTELGQPADATAPLTPGQAAPEARTPP